MAISTTEDFIDQFFDLLTAEGVVFDDLTAAKTAALPIFTDWLAGDAASIDVLRRVAVAVGILQAEVIQRYDFWTGTETGGPHGDGTYDLTMPDGSVVALPCLAKIMASTEKGDAAGIPFTFSTTTTAGDPGAGGFRLNHATIASATAAYVDNLDAGGNTQSAWLDALDDSTSAGVKGQLLIQQVGSEKRALFNVTGSVTDSTGYRTVPVAYVSGVLPDAGARCMFAFMRTGNAGNLTGPGSSTDNNVPQYDGTSGNLLKAGRAIGAANSTDLLDRAAGDGRYQGLNANLTAYAGAAWASGKQVATLTAANTITLLTVGAGGSTDLLDRAAGDGRYLGLTSGGTVAGALVLGSTLTLSGDPASALHAATKQYVDNIAAGLDVKASCRAATTANITLSGAQTIDGVSVVAADRVLVKSQTAPAENGIYVAAAGAWTRATDMDAWAEVPGANTWVEEGTANGDRSWVCTSNLAGGTLGSTAITWAQFGGTGAFQGLNANLTALSGLTGAADKLGYFTGVGAMAVTDLTATGRSIIGAADVAAARAVLGLTYSTIAQAKLGTNAATAMTPASTLAAEEGLVNILERITEMTPTSSVLQAFLAARSGFGFRAAGNVGNSAQFIRKGLSNSTALTDILTLVRATDGTAETQAGGMTTFAAGVARITSWGLLIAPSGQNLCLQSENLAVTWTTTSATISGADLIMETATTAEHRVNQATDFGSVAARTVTLSCEVEQFGTGRNVWVGINDNVTGPFGYWLDFTTGILTQLASPGAGWSAMTGRVRPLAGGKWRITITGTATAQNYSPRMGTYNGGVSFAGDIAKGVYARRAQLQTGSFETPYIPTTTVAVTHNADILSAPLAIPAGQAFTIFGRFVVPESGRWASYPIVFHLAGAANNYVTLHLDPLGRLTALGRAGGVAVSAAFIDSLVLTPGSVCCLAFTISGSAMSMSLNGRALVTSTAPTGAFGAFTTIYVGQNAAGSQQLNSYIRGLWFDPRAYSTTEQRCAATFDPAQAAIDIAAGRDPTLLDWDLDFTAGGGAAPAYKYAGEPYAAITDLPLTTFTRATDRTARTVAGYILPITSGNLALADTGLSFDPASSNILTAAYTHAPASMWSTLVDATVGTGSLACPRAGGTVTLITTTNTDGRVQRNEAVANDSVARTFSVLVEKKAITYRVSTGYGGGTAVSTIASINGSTGAVLTGVATVEDFNSLYWRVSVSATNNSSGNTIAYIYVALVGAAGLTAQVTLPMYEPLAVASAIIPSVGGVTTRNADVWLTRETNSAAYVVRLRFTPRVAPASPANVYLWQADDGTNNNRVALYLNSTTGNLTLLVIAGGVTQASIPIATYAAGTTYRLVFRIAANDFKTWLNGAQAGTADTSGTVPATTMWRLGMGLLAEQLAGEVLDFKKANRALTDAQCLALAA